ncbi:MAG: hypothetical protein MRK01_01490 [Candidatus Scalindua sp.]|nr:hypothetical protein [Candidatus Scalindua sp.]
MQFFQNGYLISTRIFNIPPCGNKVGDWPTASRTDSPNRNGFIRAGGTLLFLPHALLDMDSTEHSDVHKSRLRYFLIAANYLPKTSSHCFYYRAKAIKYDFAEQQITLKVIEVPFQKSDCLLNRLTLYKYSTHFHVPERYHLEKISSRNQMANPLMVIFLLGTILASQIPGCIPLIYEDIYTASTIRQAAGNSV